MPQKDSLLSLDALNKEAEQQTFARSGNRPQFLTCAMKLGQVERLLRLHLDVQPVEPSYERANGCSKFGEISLVLKLDRNRTGRLHKTWSSMRVPSEVHFGILLDLRWNGIGNSAELLSLF